MQCLLFIGYNISINELLIIKNTLVLYQYCLKVLDNFRFLESPTFRDRGSREGWRFRGIMSFLFHSPMNSTSPPSSSDYNVMI